MQEGVMLGVRAEAGGFFEGGLLADAHAAGFSQEHDFESLIQTGIF